MTAPQASPTSPPWRPDLDRELLSTLVVLENLLDDAKAQAESANVLLARQVRDSVQNARNELKRAVNAQQNLRLHLRKIASR
jgi:hypothetical protein